MAKTKQPDPLGMKDREGYTVDVWKKVDDGWARWCESGDRNYYFAQVYEREGRFTWFVNVDDDEWDGEANSLDAGKRAADRQLVAVLAPFNAATRDGSAKENRPAIDARHADFRGANVQLVAQSGEHAEASFVAGGGKEERGGHPSQDGGVTLTLAMNKELEACADESASLAFYYMRVHYCPYRLLRFFLRVYSLARRGALDHELARDHLWLEFLEGLFGFVKAAEFRAELEGERGAKLVHLLSWLKTGQWPSETPEQLAEVGVFVANGSKTTLR